MINVIDVDEAVRQLAQGHVVAVPTDTVYGVAAALNQPAAIAALFSLKRRPDDVALPVLIDSIAAADGLEVRLDDRALKLANAFWPGPLTVLVPASPALARTVHAKRDFVGLRIPADPLLRQLLARSGPLAVTSANDHGAPPCTSGEEVLAAFTGRSELSGVLDDGARSGTVSTVVELLDSGYRLLRVGAVSEQAIQDALAPS